MLVDKRFVYCSIICAGYLVYDFLVLFFVLKSRDATSVQTLIHHIIGVTGLWIGTTPGYGGPGLGNLTTMTELSTIFLNYRSMYSVAEMN